jgi:hypothetical protein
MTFKYKPVSSALQRIEKRFRVSRPGSVLILVVALLVLMALIGTAYISTTRIDRYSIRNNAIASQIDLAAESASNMIIDAVENDLFDGANYRGLTYDPNVPSTYENTDGFSISGPSMNLWNSKNKTASPIADPNDAWLASRYPRVLNPNIVLNVTSNNPPIWDSISYPPFQNIPQKYKNQVGNESYFWQFDVPDSPDNQANNPGFMLSLKKHWYEPTFKTVTAADGTVHTYPALRARLSGPTNEGGLAGQYTGHDYKSVGTPAQATFLAADADGDGIADSGLFRLPMGGINGLRYYAALRIIDNNSAININTAWAQGDADYTGERAAWSNTSTTAKVSVNADKLVNYFGPSSVDLGSLLRSIRPEWYQAIFGNQDPGWQGYEMQYLKNYWWNTQYLGPIGMDTKSNPNPPAPFFSTLVFGDDRLPRITGANPEFLFTSIGDAMNSQLARRLLYPGWNYEQALNYNAVQNHTVPYQAFGPENMAALAYHFGHVNPSVGRSPLDELFYQASLKANNKDSIYTTASNYATRQTSYQLTNPDITRWFNDNFYYDEPGPKRELVGDDTNYRSHRTLLVTHNPVSNQSPRRDMRGLWNMDVGLLGQGTNWQAVGPRVMSGDKIWSQTGQTMVTYNDAFTTPGNNGGVDPQFVWGEQMPFWNASEKYNYSEYIPPKAAVNTANFGDLWRAYWNVMSVKDGTETPFDRSFRGSIGFSVATSAVNGRWGARISNGLPGDGYTLNDPYVGQKFWGQATPDAPFLAEGDTYHKYNEEKPNFVPQDYPFDRPAQRVIPRGWHPARMFRSSIRATPKAGTVPVPPFLTSGLEVDQLTVFDGGTPRFPALQELLLRAAISAVNTEDLRDSDFDKDIVDPAAAKVAGATTKPVVDPRDTVNAPPKTLRGHGTGDITAHRIRLNAILEGNPEAVNVVVYGNEKQPFITEVFADTDTTLGGAGYVGIELYNPYDNDIELTNWKLVAIDRRHDISGGSVTYKLRLQDFPFPVVPGTPSSPQLIADFDPLRQTPPQVWPKPMDPNGNPLPLIVPARGYLLLENFGDTTNVGATGTAVKRPKSTGLPEGSAIATANKGTDRSYDDTGLILNKRDAAKLPQLNVACVPGLSGMLDTVWTQTSSGPGQNAWPAMRSVLNRELVLLRPRRADGVYSRGFYPPLFNVNQNKIAEPMHFDENWSLNDLVPVDSFDFTGLQLPSAGGDALHSGSGQAAIWHYVRQNADAAVSGTPDPDARATQFEPGKWKFVYPGRYDGSPSNTAWTAGAPYPGAAPVWGANLQRGRQQGTETITFADGTDPSVWPPPGATSALTPVTLGEFDNNNITASYPTRFPIQLHAEGWQTNSLVTSAWEGLDNNNKPDSLRPSAALFPFGGIPRTADLMQVPFIGAYRVSRNTPTALMTQFANTYPSGPKIVAEPPPGMIVGSPPNPTPAQAEDILLLELNSITADSVFAEDTDLDDDPRFQINTAPPVAGTAAVTGNIDPSANGLSAGRQKWTSDNQTTQGREQVGRFAPLITLMRLGDDRISTDGEDIKLPQALYADASNPPNYIYYNAGYPLPVQNEKILIHDYANDPSFRPPDANKGAVQVGADWSGYWRYQWATRLFDFLTVQAPHDDAMPDYPRHQTWQFNTDYTPGMIVEYTDRQWKNLPLGLATPNPLYMKPCLYVCTKAHNSGNAFTMGFSNPPGIWNQDPDNWHLLTRIPQSNSGGQAGSSGDAKTYSAEYPQAVQGLININTANWKVLATLPLVVNPNSGMTVDPNVNPSPTTLYGNVEIPNTTLKRRSTGVKMTYRDLSEELAKAIEYYRDQDGQPNPHGPPPNDPPEMVPHGPFKSIFELNEVTDLRTLVDWTDSNDPNNPNPFRGHGFADAMGLLQMKYLDPNDKTTPPGPGEGDPDGGVNDLSPGIKIPDPINPSKWISKFDGVRGDFEEQFLQLSRISNLITTRSDSFTCYILVQGWKNAGTPQAEMVLQKRVAYILDRSGVPYLQVKKTIVPND